MSVIPFPGPGDDGPRRRQGADGADAAGAEDAGATVLPMAEHVARRAAEDAAALAELDAHLSPQRRADIAWIEAVAARIAAEFGARPRGGAPRDGSPPGPAGGPPAGRG